MGQNHYGYWNDRDLVAAQRRLDMARRRIGEKYMKRHNALVAKLTGLGKAERAELDAAKQRWAEETDAAVTLWADNAEGRQK